MRPLALLALVALGACGKDGTGPRAPTVYRFSTSNLSYEAFDSRPDYYYRERWLGPASFNTLTLTLDAPARGDVQLIGQLEAPLRACSISGTSSRPGPADCDAHEVSTSVRNALWLWYFQDVAAQGTYAWRGDSLHVDFPADSIWLTSGGGFGATWVRVGNNIVYSTSYDDVCAPPSCSLLYEAKIIIHSTWIGQ